MDPLTVAPADLAAASRVPFEIVADNAALVRRFADDMIEEYRGARDAGRDKIVFIVPVGPVGQFDLVADYCNGERFSLADLVVINMDEYLDPTGHRLIAMDDPLSFRRHMEEHFYRKLDPALAPPAGQRLFPDPADPGAIGRAIDRHGGVDVTFGGVGITGHLAFNDPPEPGEPMQADAFAALSTRVVALSRETRLVNAINAARGNIDRIPERAITVGMEEILASRKVRIYMNRAWQPAIARKALCGPVTAGVPASLLQRHPDARFVITEEVAELPEPELR